MKIGLGLGIGLRGRAPGVAPQQSGVLVNGTTTPAAVYTASRLTSLTVSFNTTIVSVDAAAFTLTRGGTTLTNGSGVSVTGTGTNTLTLQFTPATGVEYGSLADGIWTLSTNMTKVYSAGGAGTGTVTTNHIRRLFGDGNGDGVVNLEDNELFGKRLRNVGCSIRLQRRRGSELGRLRTVFEPIRDFTLSG